MKYRVIIIIVITFIGILLVSYSIIEMGAKDEWNNGVCVECGGEYRLLSTAWNKAYGMMYTYECENCHHAFDSVDILK